MSARHRHGVVAIIEAWPRRPPDRRAACAKAAKKFTHDVAFYVRLFRAKKLQRSWMQRTGRWYEALLPERSSFE